MASSGNELRGGAGGWAAQNSAAPLAGAAGGAAGGKTVAQSLTHLSSSPLPLPDLLSSLSLPPSTVSRWPLWLCWAPLTILAGLAQAVSLATPWNGQPLWWLQLLSLAVLAWQLTGSGPIGWRGYAMRGWVFATAWLTGTFWWLFISLHTYGGLAAPVAAVAVGSLAAVLGLYFAVICACFKAFEHSTRRRVAINFAALWLLAELMRAQWFTGFPWGASGYAHVDGPLAGYAPLVGVYGLGAVAAALAMLLAQCARRVQASRGVIGGAAVAAAARVAVLVPALVVVAVLAGGALLQRLQLFAGSSAGVLQVALLQGNIAQDEKFQLGSGVATALAWYGDQLARAQAPLVVAPETAIPLLPQQLPPGFQAELQQQFGGKAGAPGDEQGRQTGRAALIGMPLGNLASGYTNAVVGFKPGQAAGGAYRYEKHHLVPFGEFVPPLFRWFTDLMQIPLGDFNRGALPQPGFVWQGQRLAPNICYEDLFGEEIGAQFLSTATAPTMLVNVSNIGWFGDSVAIDQHLQISRMRAVEFARPMLRATNTGATAIINHRGQVTHALPRLTRGVLVGDVQGRNGTTPYAWWVARWSLWPLWLVALLVALSAARPVWSARGR